MGFTMKKIQPLVLIALLIASFIYSSEKKDFHVSYILEKTRQCFGETIDYFQLKEEITKHKLPEEYNNKWHTTSNNGKMVCIYSQNENKEYGFFDIIKREEDIEILKEDIDFRKYAFPVITSLKLWSKKHNLKVPKPLVSIILQGGYTKYDFNHHYDRSVHTNLMTMLREKFPTYTCSTLFIDENYNIVVTFKDPANNNIVYTQSENYAHRLIVPEKVHTSAFLRVNPELCMPGEITIKRFEKNYEKNIFVLKAIKDGKEYSIDL